jgi:hypothetical protein
MLHLLYEFQSSVQRAYNDLDLKQGQQSFSQDFFQINKLFILIFLNPSGTACNPFHHENVVGILFRNRQRYPL